MTERADYESHPLTAYESQPSTGRSPWTVLGDRAPEFGADSGSWRAPYWNEPMVRPSRLAEVIAREVVPSLVRSHLASAEEERPATMKPEPGEMIGFAHLILSNNADIAFAEIDQMMSRGIAIETIFVDLLAPTARYLGDLWTEDAVDFVQVTLGLGRLQQILRDLSPILQSGARLSRLERNILLVAVPGEQHTFGLVMVAEFFLHAGWNVQGGPMTSAGEMALMVGRDWFDVVGFSLASHTRVDQLAENIRAIRTASRNKNLSVIVGGPAFLNHPELVARVGADAMAADGQEGPTLAEKLLTRFQGIHEGDAAPA